MPVSGQLNLCNELEDKSLKFVTLAMRYVSCLNYLCCFSRSHIDEQFLSYFFVKKYLLVGASSILWTGQRVSESVSQ